MRGRHTATIDAKGRLKIPAQFRASFDALGSDYFVTSFDGKCALVYPVTEWEKVEAKQAAIASMDPIARRFARVVNFWGQEASLDAQGRILIPQQLRESASLSGEVAVMATAERLEVWNLAQITHHIADGITDEQLAHLGNLGV